MVRRNAGTPGVQVAPDSPVAAVSRFRRCCAGTQPPRSRRRAIDSLLNLSSLTVVILTLNEQDALPGALASLPPGTQVLVVDAGSRDETCAIARTAGATVLERPWRDFIDARRFALSRVTTPWTFMLDADERLDATLRTALVEANPDSGGVAAYRVRRATRFCGKIVRAFGWDRENIVRIFRIGSAVIEAHPVAGGAAPVHERWDVEGAIEQLAGTLLHDSYPDRAAYRRKFERYTSLEATGLQPRAGAFAWSAMLAVPRFFWLLGARSGLRMGWRGVYLAFWSALYPAVAQWKALREHR